MLELLAELKPQGLPDFGGANESVEVLLELGELALRLPHALPDHSVHLLATLRERSQ